MVPRDSQEYSGDVFRYGASGTHLRARLLQVDDVIHTELWETVVNDSTWDSGWRFASAPFSSIKKFWVSLYLQCKACVPAAGQGSGN